MIKTATQTKVQVKKPVAFMKHTTIYRSRAAELARTYRLMAGRCHLHISNGTAAALEAKTAIATAEAALVKAFNAIETANKV